jgi:hypothetical protein
MLAFDGQPGEFDVGADRKLPEDLAHPRSALSTAWVSAEDARVQSTVCSCTTSRTGRRLGLTCSVENRCVMAAAP